MVVQPSSEANEAFEKLYGGLCDDLDEFKGTSPTDDEIDLFKDFLNIRLKLYTQIVRQDVIEGLEAKIVRFPK